MFCDLVGSTALSTSLDPEDMREVLRAYQEACAGVIDRYDGYVAKFMGDGVYAYFGYPRAHEDDAERAINAGLGIVEAVKELERNLQVRIGIATGTVVVGDIVGVGAAQEAAITGETPNLAARLQEIAAPDTMVIGEATRSLVGGLFEIADLGRHELKGFGAAVRAWAVRRRRVTESRFEAIRGAHLTALVGRDEEIEILLRRWERARAGEGQVVLISGEPGIGKSRLLHELDRRIGDETPHRLRFQCSPYHTNTALHPVIEHLQRAAGFDATDDDTARIGRLEAMVARSGLAVAETAPLLAPLLSVPDDGRYPSIEVSPQRRKELTLQALVDHLAGLARGHPVLFVLEDMHWIDPTTLELMELTVERALGLPVLILMTHRPEFQAPWVGRARVTPMILGRLDGRDCARLVEHVVARAPLSDELRHEIVARTDGVPLFVEEMTKSVLEATAERPDAPTAFEIPATLQDSFEARLDRLGPVKEIAQIGAVIGREFPYALIVAATTLGDDALAAALDRLAEAEIVFVRGSPPDAVYTFKHALLQDTAYGSLLRGRRAELHGRVATVLRENFPDRADAEPEMLARHFTEAGRSTEAVEFWYRAGRAAAERFANSEAIDHFERALAMLADATDLADRQRRELDILAALGPTLLALHGIGGEAPRATFERARALSTELGDIHTLFGALWGLWISHGLGGDAAIRQGLVAELLAIAERSGDADLELQAHHAAWGGPFEVRRADHLEHIERGLAIYDPARHVPAARHFGGHDAGVCGLAHAAITLWALGRPDQAMARSREALALAEEISHYPPGRTQAASFSATLHYYARDWPRTREFAERAIAIGRDCGALLFVHLALPVYAVALANSGEADAALQAIEDRAQVFGERGHPNTGVYMLPLEGEALAAMGRTGDAITRIDEGLALAAGRDVRFWEPYTFWLKGTVLLADRSGRRDEAAACFEAAIAGARALEAPMWELRASTALARLRHGEGRTDEARDLLAPVYSWFTEGFDTADLKEAKALLNELS